MSIRRTKKPQTRKATRLGQLHVERAKRGCDCGGCRQVRANGAMAELIQRTNKRLDQQHERDRARAATWESAHPDAGMHLSLGQNATEGLARALGLS